MKTEKRCERLLLFLQIRWAFSGVRAAMQADLFSWVPPAILGDRNGLTYEPKRDRKRLNKQAIAVYQFMSDNQWHSLRDISEATGAPEASASARLRDFRSEKFGGFNVERRHLSKGMWQYRLIA